MKKNSLASLVDKIDWLMLAPVRGNKVDQARINVAFGMAKKDGEINRITIQIGQEIIEEMGWNKGDRIFIYNNPNDLMVFRLIKSGTGSGWKLAYDVLRGTYKLQFTWMHKEVILKKRYSLPVEHEIHKGNILFRVGDEAEFD